MKHLGTKIFLLILFLVLVVGGVYMIMNPSGLALPFTKQEKAAEPAPSAKVQPTPEIREQTEEEPVATEPTPVPAPAAPQPTEAPPEPTEDPYGVVLSSGTISSDKPWLINIHADWTAVTAAGDQAEITVVVYADHYALTYGSTESLRIRLGEDSVLLTTKDISTEVNQPQSTELGRQTFSVPLKTAELPLEISWDFQGMYVDDAGNYFDVHGISCEGTVTVTG